MLKRLPKYQDILQVYAVIALMLSGWTIIAFLWKLSAWMLILNMEEILTVFSYAMVSNIVESLIVLLLLLAICALLPSSILRDDFVFRGTILSVGFIGSLMAFVRFHMQFGIESGVRLLIGPLAVLLLTALLLAFLAEDSFCAFCRSLDFRSFDRVFVYSRAAICHSLCLCDFSKYQIEV